MVAGKSAAHWRILFHTSSRPAPVFAEKGIIVAVGYASLRLFKACLLYTSLTSAINQREEKFEDYEIYALDLAQPTPRQLTHNQAQEEKLHWANDNRHLFFSVQVGDVSGPYRDLQPHLYWLDSEKPGGEKPDSETGAVEQWSRDFIGPVEHYAVAAEHVLASARLGTEVAMYSVSQPGQSMHKLNGWQGTYEILSSESHTRRIAFVYSSLQKPAEVYLADGPDKLDQARPITCLLYTSRCV